MIKKTPASKARIGMYVYDLDCGWIRITQEYQIDKIKKDGVKEFYIDTDKGIDVEEKPVIIKSRETDCKSELLSPNISNSTHKKSLTNELLRAKQVKQEAIQAVSTIMEDARLGKLIDLKDHIEPVVENIISSVLSNKDALLGIMRVRKLDKYTFEHSVGSSILLVAFGESLALSKDELMQIGIGGLLMDIGKSITPPEILTKPGRLLNDELATMRKHVEHSKGIVEKIPNASEIVMNVTIEHHERVDGSGYPAGKKGEDISLYGQMAAIVDVYDALTVNRVYCSSISSNAALKKLVACSSEFNQELVQHLIHCIGVYPVGSLVALSNGLFAVVIKSSDKGLLHPVIRVMFDSIKREFIMPHDIDLSDQGEKEIVKIVSAVEPDKWRINPTDFMEHAKYC